VGCSSCITTALDSVNFGNRNQAGIPHFEAVQFTRFDHVVDGRATFAQSWDLNGLDPSTFKELTLDDGSPFPGLSINDAGDCVPATAQLGVVVWFDDNLNGIFDPGESGVPGLTTELYADVNGDGLLDAGDILLTSTATAVGGLYLFDNLPPGNYVVKVTTDATLSTNGSTVIADGHTRFSNLGIGESDVTVMALASSRSPGCARPVIGRTILTPGQSTRSLSVIRPIPKRKPSES
jgi:hypothetical protein